jgi:amino acid permease
VEAASLAMPRAEPGLFGRSPKPAADGADGASSSPAAQQGAFGAKTIGYWSSCCLNLNNVMGAAIVALPLVNQQAGWITPTLCILFVFLISSFAATMLVEAMQRVPGNSALTERWEFCALVGHYFGPRAQTLASVLYNISLQSTNVAAMIVSAQVLDVFIIYVAGHSVALDYHEWPPHLIRSEPSLTDPSQGSLTDPWLTQWVISAGFVVSAVIAVPLGYINLEDNMKFQWASLVGLLLFTSEFFVQFALNLVPGTRWGEARLDPALGGPPQVPGYKAEGQYQVLGVAIFAYAYVTTIPSWANEKVPSVNVNSAIWWPALAGTVLKLLAGTCLPACLPAYLRTAAPSLPQTPSGCPAGCLAAWL